MYISLARSVQELLGPEYKITPWGSHYMIEKKGWIFNKTVGQISANSISSSDKSLIEKLQKLESTFPELELFLTI